MNKYRPEKITLTTPPKFAEKFERMLKENLHKRAKLKREDLGVHVIFSFYPTKSEYFLISFLFSNLCKELGGTEKDASTTA